MVCGPDMSIYIYGCFEEEKPNHNIKVAPDSQLGLSADKVSSNGALPHINATDPTIVRT
jgi:hypothetical protein